MSEAERKCDEANIDSDAIHIHGSLSKHEKFWRIRLFCGNASDDLQELNLRMLFSTNASNVGIDDKDIVFGIRYEWPRDLPTYFQERGRLARILGTLATFILMADLSSFDFLMRQSLSSEFDDNATSTSELQQQVLGANSVISPLRNNAARAAQVAQQKTTTYALKRDGRRRLMTRQVRELLEVVRFFCTNRGCQHRASAHYLSTGRLTTPPPTDNPCRTRCPICTKQWHKQFLPIYQQSLVCFFQSSKGRDRIPFCDSTKLISDVLWGDAYWLEKIFDRAAGGMRRAQVDALFLSLAAVGIMKMEKAKGGTIRWNIGWSKDDTPLYNKSLVWRGINLHHHARPRRRNHFLMEVLSHLVPTTTTQILKLLTRQWRIWK